MGQKEYQFEYDDEFGAKQTVNYRVGEYDNLMMLLFDKYYQEWGDCRGRAWCGTCHIQITSGTVSETVGQDEKRTLARLDDFTLHSRLACQVPVDERLQQFTFRITKGI